MASKAPPLSARAAAGAEAVGGLYALGVDTLVATFRVLRHGRFAWSEFWSQMWFIASVTVLPAVLVAIPFGVVVVIEVGSVAGEIGASSYTGAVDALTIVREAGPLVTALMLAGVAGSAICADLGARKIRDEIDALETLGISPLERLVAPRLVAAVVVAVLLNGFVMFVGIVGGYLYFVLAQHGTAGSYLISFTEFARPGDVAVAEVKSAVFGLIAALVSAHYGLNAKGGPKGVGDAVNRSVVVAFIIVFVANTIISSIYLALVPAQGL